MRFRVHYFFLPVILALSACSSGPEKDKTISSLPDKNALKLVEKPVKLELKRDEAAEYYRKFLQTAKPGPLYGDAMRRLADLELHAGQSKSLSDDKLNIKQSQKKIKDAIRLYETYLETYPNRKNNDLILYQLAKAYELDTNQEKLLATLNTLLTKYPGTQYEQEAQFRRGETRFVMGNYPLAEKAYHSILSKYPDSTYYDKALYKYGWTRFKQVFYPDATKAFIELLDRQHKMGKLAQDGPVDSLSLSEKELLSDVLRVISLSFSYQQGHRSITDFFNNHGARPYEAMIYNNLAELYLEKSRIRDAATTFIAYADRYPDSIISAKSHERAITAYETGGFASLVLGTKIEYVKRYNVGTRFWKLQKEADRHALGSSLKKHLRELAQHYHAIARKKKEVKTFKKAIKWYKLYITSFPTEVDTANMNFLLAEANQDIGQYQTAIYEFENTAYKYPKHKKSADAAYAALLLYPVVNKSVKPKDKPVWTNKKINNSLKFADSFPSNKHTASILANTAELLFSIGDYTRAISTAGKIDSTNSKNAKLITNAQLVQAHSEFELKNYANAEKSYHMVLQRLSRKKKLYRDVLDKYAASIYKQAEIARSTGKLAAAAALFIRMADEVPHSKLRAAAEYDAATIYIELKSWQKAKNTLLRFRKTFPATHKLQFGVTEKLAYIYNQSGQPLKAAKEIEVLTRSTQYTQEQRRSLLWEAASIYQKHNKTKPAIRIFKSIIKNHPAPLEQAIEARASLAEIYRKSSWKKHFYWLREIIKADNKGGKKRSQRTLYLAADAHLKLTLPIYTAYKKVKLTAPLKRSLKKKKKLMQDTIKAYENTMKYRIPEFTTSATFYIAEVYNDFANALLKSKRPKNLNADELEQYNILLEEQAFPFEEKAIEIHQANADRVKDKIYDKWIKKSINALAKLNPVRYAKVEKSENYLEYTHVN